MKGNPIRAKPWFVLVMAGRLMRTLFRLGWRMVTLAAGVLLILAGMALGLTPLAVLCGLPLVMLGLILAVMLNT